MPESWSGDDVHSIKIRRTAKEQRLCTWFLFGFSACTGQEIPVDGPLGARRGGFGRYFDPSLAIQNSKNRTSPIQTHKKQIIFTYCVINIT